MRIVVTGAQGQLGRAVCAACDPQHELVVWGRSDADITRPQMIQQICDARPDVVINCAAWTNVDGAEKEPDAAFAVNALGVRHLAIGCANIGAALVHVSTNEVFAGDAGRFYYEDELPAPRSVYARSKVAGEVAASRVLTKLAIVRVAWLFGPGGNNFPSKIVAGADRHGALKVVNEEFGNPTYAPDAADAILALVERESFGVFHLVNDGFASRYDFARETLQAMGRAHVPIEPIGLLDWPRPAPPPPHAVLVNQAAAAQGIVLRPWQAAVAAYAETMLEMSES